MENYKQSHPESRTAAATVPGDERAVMDHTVLQLDPYIWVRGYQLAVVAPVQGGDLVHQGRSALERQSIPFEDHLTLRWQQGEGVQLQRTI